MIRTSRRANAGFTLVELLVVITIIALIMGIVGPRVLNYLTESKAKAAKIQIESFSSALDLYFLDLGRYPTSNEGLSALTRSNNQAGWNGPYLNKGVMVNGNMTVSVPAANGTPGTGLLDPWGNPYYVYTFANNYSATAGGVVLLSRGPNGAANTTVANVFANTPAQDDLIQVVTYSP